MTADASGNGAETERRRLRPHDRRCVCLTCSLFVAVGVGFIFVHLWSGKLIRPNRPDAEKLTIYECGEPTDRQSAWIQFDLRFYVVALLFVIFDVEVAFFFPWAVVFGKANELADERSPIEQRQSRPTAIQPRPTAAEPRRRRRTRRSDAGLARVRRHPGVLRRAAGRLRLPVEARRPATGCAASRGRQHRPTEARATGGRGWRLRRS